MPSLARARSLGRIHGYTNRKNTLPFVVLFGRTLLFVGIEPETVIHFVPSRALNEFVCASNRQMG